MRLLRAELIKAVRRPRTYVAFAVLTILPIVMTIALESNPPDAPGRGGGGGLFFLASNAGMVMPAAALRLMSAFLLIIVVAIFGGDAVAGDASTGNLRYLLMRPVGRARLILTKLVVATILAWCAVAAVVLVALVAGGIAFGWGPLEVDLGGFGGGVLQLQSVGELLANLALASAYVAWCLTGLVAFTFMLSCMSDSPAAATVAGVGLYITSQIMDAIEPLGRLRRFLPTHYFDSWITLFTQNEVSSDLWRGVVLQLAYIVAFTGFALWWFRRKDILS